MSERCSECRGEGEVWDDRDGRYRFCMNCGGEGRIDPYQEDEWYDENDEDDEDETTYCEDFPEDCLNDQGEFVGYPTGNSYGMDDSDQDDVTPPSPIGDSDHDHA